MLGDEIMEFLILFFNAKKSSGPSTLPTNAGAIQFHSLWDGFPSEYHDFFQLSDSGVNNVSPFFCPRTEPELNHGKCHRNDSYELMSC